MKNLRRIMQVAALVMTASHVSAAEIKEIDRVMKINDEILKHLIVKHDA